MHRIERNPRTRHLVPGTATCAALLVTMCTFGVTPAGAQTAPSPLTLTKTGTLDPGSDGVANVGDLIDYTFEVVNSDVECDVEDLLVSDPLISPISCTSGNPIPLLLPNGGSETCTGSYPITQADIDNGSVFNTATAAGRICTEVPIEATDDELVPIPQVPAIELTKSGVLDTGADGVANVGEVITYSLMVTNTGNIALLNVTLSDPSLASFNCPSGHPISSLAPGASETCTGSYAITQADIDAGFRENSASVLADPGIGGAPQQAQVPVGAQAMLRLPIPQQPLIVLTKTGVVDLGANGVADAGDLINYTFEVDNTGNVTLINLAVTDPLIAPIACPSGNPIPSLAPAASETCTGSYVLTAADVAAGSVPNTADVAGLDPTQQPVSNSDSDMVMLPQPMPSLGRAGLMVLALALAAAGALILRRRRTV